MPRQKLPSRRAGVTQRVPVELDGGRIFNLLVTMGFPGVPVSTRPTEVFCADFKAGTALHTIIMDACILLSRLLQHGTPPDVLYASLSQPPSVIGAIAKAVADFPFNPDDDDPEPAGQPVVPPLPPASLLGYSGDTCPDCQNATMVRNGTCLKCETCGATTGCS